MGHKVLTFRETLTAAAKTVPGLINGNGGVNTSAVARHCRDKGHPVSQPTLHRHYKGKRSRRVDDETAQALSAVFRIPARIWKGDQLADNEEQALSQANLEDLLLAQKIGRLPKKARDNILNQIEDAADSQEQLKRALTTGNVTPITRTRN